MENTKPSDALEALMMMSNMAGALSVLAANPATINGEQVVVLNSSLVLGYSERLSSCADTLAKYFDVDYVRNR